MRSQVHDLTYRLALFLAVLLLTGCGGRTMLAPTPNLYWAREAHPFDEVPEPLRTTTVDLVYATDRVKEKADEQKVTYGYGRSHSLVLGEATVTFGDEELTWEELAEASTKKKREKDIWLTVTSVKETIQLPPSNTPSVTIDGVRQVDPKVVAQEEAATHAFHELLARRLEMTPVKDVFIFIHGYNNTFEDAAYRLATLWHFIGRQGVPLLYSWPAGAPGMIRGYTHDRESSEFTVFHCKQFMRMVATCPDVERIHVVAHSRGTDVALSMLRELWIEFRGGDRHVTKLANVVIAAADIDWEVFQQRVSAERLPVLLNSFVFYLSADDKAIGISRWLFSSLARIGKLTADLLTPAQRDSLEESYGTQVIEAKVDTGFLGHSYFITNPAALSDLILVLRDELPPGAKHGRPLRREDGGFWVLTDDYLVGDP